jgi:DDHD domain
MSEATKLPPIRTFPEHGLGFTGKFRTLLPENLSTSSPSFLPECRITPFSNLRTPAELKDDEKSSKRDQPVDYVLFYIHGIGSTFESLQKTQRNFQRNLDNVAAKYFSKSHIVCHVEAINWKDQVEKLQDEMIARCLYHHSDDVTNWRNHGHRYLMDIGFAMIPHRKHFMVNFVGNYINNKMDELKSEDPIIFRNSQCVLVGFSLGTVITHELLMNQKANFFEQSTKTDFIPRNFHAAEDKSPSDAKIVQLKYPVHSVYFCGSPVAAFLSLASDKPRFTLPLKIPRFYNIFDPRDPVAFRLEPLFYDDQDPDFTTPLPLAKLKQFKRGFTMEGENSKRRRIDFILKRTTKVEFITPLTMLYSHAGYTSDPSVGYFIISGLLK